MSNHYLKNGDATRVYRLEYDVTDGRIEVHGAFACGVGEAAVLPNANAITRVDEPVDVAQVLVDHIVNGLVAATVEEYRTLAKSMLDDDWS